VLADIFDQIPEPDGAGNSGASAGGILISAIPVPDPAAARRRILLKGDPPSPINSPSGCRFHTRCPYAEPVCSQDKPALRPVGDGRSAACHFAERWMS